MSFAELTRVFTHIYLRDPNVDLDSLLEPASGEHAVAAAEAVKGRAEALLGKFRAISTKPKRGATGPAAPQGEPAPRSSTDVLVPPIYTYVPPTDRGRSQKPNSTAVTSCIHEIPSWGLFRSFIGGGIHHRGLLHHHHGPSDEV